MTITHHSPLTTHQTEEGEQIEGYRPICGLALAGAALGAASILVYVHPLFWSVAFTGVAVNGLALWRIAASRGVLVGRWPALAGLSLSLVFGATSATHALLQPSRLRATARGLGEQWLEAFQAGNIELAHQLSFHPAHRWPLDERLAERYRIDSRRRFELGRYRHEPAVIVLAELGPRAQARYLRNEDLEITPDEYRVADLYEVGDGKSIAGRAAVVRVISVAMQDKLTHQWFWFIKRAELVEEPAT